MSLQNGVQCIEIERLMNYFGGAGGNSALDSRSEQQGGGDDDRYVSRQ